MDEQKACEGSATGGSGMGYFHISLCAYRGQRGGGEGQLVPCTA